MDLHSTEGLREEGSTESSFRALSCELPTAGLQIPADSGNLLPQQLHETNASRNRVEDRSGLSSAALAAVNLPAKRREALRWVALYPGRSARELERLSGLRKINARLSELEAQGVVEGRGYTTCSVTGRVATAWRPTGLPPRPLVRRPTTLQRLRTAENEVQQLREEVERLRAALTSAQRGQLGLSEVAQ